jgi:hypothetical protein
LYRELNFQKVSKTLYRLTLRIGERFPDSGLSSVCGELNKMVSETDENLAFILKPNRFLRGSIALLITLILISIAFSIHLIEFENQKMTLPDLLQLSEAAVNELVLIGAAIFFFITLETRIKRTRALKSINELRSFAHVIDMHQLVKDPTGVGTTSKTLSSPNRTMTAFELTRYLDYCSEMLAIIGKVAASYAQHIPDPNVLAAVNDIETLTTSLSRKIWQKLIVLEQNKSR